MATNVNMTGTVKNVNSFLHVRNRPSMNGDIIGRILNGTTLNITQMEGEWCYATDTGGWSHVSYIALTNNDQSRAVAVSKEQQQVQTQEANERAKQAELERQVELIDISTADLTDTEITDSLIINNLNGVYGIPYQFMESVDPRISKTNDQPSDFGRKYSEKIISKMPLLCITPGKVDFMSNYSKEEQTGLLASLITGDQDTDVSNIIKHNGRYFTFAFAYQEYFSYVNSLCGIGAKFLNIQDIQLDIGDGHGKAADFNWENALNSKLKSTLTSQEFIAFYMDSTDSVSESFSNSTTQSQLINTLNGFSDTAREISFLLGNNAGKEFQLMDEAQLKDTMAAIDGISSKYLNGSTLFSTIANNFATIAVGGKLLFPEIWADSEFSRDFDITIKLRTPDSDVVSWYLNIYVPLCHLIGLAAGHQTETANGYYSPFLIRAYYKGLFNIDMGIVTNMSIRKGKEAAWNIDGLPTEIDIDLTIKDLYSMLSIVPGTEPKNFVTNNLLMDYIANTCGININQLDIQRSLEIYAILWKNKTTDLPNRIMRKFQDSIDNRIKDLYESSLSRFLI